MVVLSHYGDKQMKKKVLSSLQSNLRRDYIMRSFTEEVERRKPYVDGTTGMVFWGTDSSRRKEKKDT